MRVFLVGAHRTAHDHEPRELAPVRERVALVELHAHQVEATGAQLVLERRRRLAGDVLQHEQGGIHAGTRYLAVAREPRVHRPP